MTIKGEPHRNGSEAALIDNLLIRRATKEEMINTIIDKFPENFQSKSVENKKRVWGRIHSHFHHLKTIHELKILQVGDCYYVKEDLTSIGIS